MRLLADENVDRRIIKILRDKGFDTCSIYELAPGITDQEVLQLATNETRVIITSDLDFANVLALPIQKHQGICLLRTKTPDYRIRALHLLAALDQLKDTSLQGRIAVIRENQLRVYPKED